MRLGSGRGHSGARPASRGSFVLLHALMPQFPYLSVGISVLSEPGSSVRLEVATSAVLSARHRHCL